MSSGGIKWAAGSAGRLVVTRILPGQDLIAGLETVCRQAGVEQGTIQCCIGSLRKATVMWLVPNSEAKVGAAYCAPQVIDGPIEFLSAQGTIAPTGPNEVFIHLHGTLADREGRLWGGHFVKDGNPVLVTVEVAITEVEGMVLARVADEEVGMSVMVPKSASGQ